jgi:hypothetical protein
MSDGYYDWPGALQERLDRAEHRLALLRSLADQYAEGAKALRPATARIFRNVAEDLYRILDAKD